VEKGDAERVSLSRKVRGARLSLGGWSVGAKLVILLVSRLVNE
jgi:hypothetical protein